MAQRATPDSTAKLVLQGFEVDVDNPLPVTSIGGGGDREGSATEQTLVEVRDHIDQVELLLGQIRDKVDVEPDASELATEQTAKAIQRGAPDQERRFEWQVVGADDKPLYIGTAPADALTSDPVWAIERYTFGGGQAGEKPTLIQTRTGAWDDREVLF